MSDTYELDRPTSLSCPECGGTTRRDGVIHKGIIQPGRKGALLVTRVDLPQFEQQVHQCQDRVYAYACTILSDRTAAADVTPSGTMNVSDATLMAT